MTSIIRTISIKGSPKRYYTGFINKKQHIYIFSNDQAVDECAFFIAQYKSMYGEFPEINKPENNSIPIKNERIHVLKQKSILSIIEEELVIESDSLDYFTEYCAISNMCLLLIHGFEFKLNNKKTDVMFSAESIIPYEINVDIKKYLDTLHENY